MYYDGNMNSGYCGYSMSNRAVEAYENGEKPLSGWTKTEMLRAIKKLVEEDGLKVRCNLDKLEKLKVSDLRCFLLRRSSWHHTSIYCNETTFYDIDVSWLQEVTDEELDRIAETSKLSEQKKDITVKYRGDIYYTVWDTDYKPWKSGRRSRRRENMSHEESYKGVNIEEKGCFYIVTDDEGKILIRKKIGSSGTRVERYDYCK